MTKSKDKGTRAPVGEEESVHKFTDADKHRMATGVRRRMDIDHYLRMPEYKDSQLFWATSRNGDVESKIALGAQPVPKIGAAGKVFKGINDRSTDQYEIAHGVSVGKDGVSEDNYLMFMPKEAYEATFIKPLQNRNDEIRKAMGIGKPDADAVTMPGVTGLKTYAPNVGNGETGLSTIQAGEMIHDV